MRSLIPAAVCAAFLVSTPAPALAGHSGPCAPRDDFLASLAEKYAEVPVARAMTNNGWMLEITASPGGEIWSMIVTRPSGVACGLASGEGWKTLDPPPPEDPAA